MKKNPLEEENGFSVMSESGMRHNFMENTYRLSFTVSFIISYRSDFSCEQTSHGRRDGSLRGEFRDQLFHDNWQLQFLAYFNYFGVPLAIFASINILHFIENRC